MSLRDQTSCAAILEIYKKFRGRFEITEEMDVDHQDGLYLVEYLFRTQVDVFDN